MVLVSILMIGKLDDLLQDADARAKFRQKSKIEAGVSFLRTAQYENMDEFWHM